jgi:UDP:flavonoid glycosyltransferase YjiC (YdhE family)
MATVLYAWELGANLGHIVPLSRIAAALGNDHRQVYAVRDLAQAEAVLGPSATVFQAPVWPGHRHFGARSGGAGAGLASYADVLTAVGFADAGKISAMMGAWWALIEAVRPDVVVADHAPGLAAALYQRPPPVVAVGSGFTMPPLDHDRFPPLRGDRAPAVPEPRLLDAVRRAAAARGRERPADLVALFRTAGRVVFGLPELDPYRSFRREGLVAPPGGLPGPQPWPREKRLFVYVGGEAENFDRLAQALAMLDVPVEAYLRGEIGPVPEFLRMRGITVHDTPPGLAEVLARASHVITQGGAMTSAAVFAAGRPHLVIPTHDESLINLALLEQHGVARALRVSEDAAEVAAAITEFLADAAMPDAALAEAQRIGGRPLPDGAEVAAAAIRSALG